MSSNIAIASIKFTSYVRLLTNLKKFHSDVNFRTFNYNLTGHPLILNKSCLKLNKRQRAKLLPTTWQLALFI